MLFPTENISATEAILSFTFRDETKSTLASALNASGNTLLLHGIRIAPNKRLAIYGDVLMTKILCTKWLASGTPLSDWSAIRSTTLATKALGKAGKDAGLDSAVAVQDGTKEVSVNMMASVIQALVAAVHIDAATRGEADRAVEEVMVKLGIVSELLKTTPDEWGVCFC